MNQNPSFSTPASAAGTAATGAQPLADGANTPPAQPSAPPVASPPVAKTVKASRTAVITMLLVAVAGVLMILWGWHLGPFATAMERTDNAYVRGQITVLAPQVNGYAAEVMVHDFERVEAGQILVRIDDRIYTQKMHAA